MLEKVVSAFPMATITLVFLLAGLSPTIDAVPTRLWIFHLCLLLDGWMDGWMDG
jgi:hypothetical protein